MQLYNTVRRRTKIFKTFLTRAVCFNTLSTQSQWKTTYLIPSTKFTRLEINLPAFFYLSKKCVITLTNKVSNPRIPDAFQYYQIVAGKTLCGGKRVSKLETLRGAIAFTMQKTDPQGRPESTLV